MNSKAKAKKNMTRLVALVLAGMIFIGMLAVGTGTTNMTGTGFDFGSLLTKDGFFKDVTASEVVELPDYSAYEMPLALTEVSDDIVMQAIQQEVLDKAATEEKDTSADRIAEKGDKVNLNYKGTIDGVEFEGGAADNYDLTLGSGAFIPGFEDAVIGHKVGENFDIDVTFPEDYVDPEKDAEGAELFNGKAAVFNITINHMYTKITPELTDEFVKENYAEIYTDVEDMKAGYKASLIDQQKKYYVENLFFTETEITGEVPAAVTQYVQEQLKANLEATGAQFGMTAEDVVTLYGVDTLEEYYEMAGAETYEKMYLLTQAFYEKEGLTVGDAEITAYFDEMYGDQDYTDIIAYYGKPYIKQSIMYETMLETVIERLPVVDMSANTDAE